MNLFLTGATGFCGCHIGRRLMREGHKVWALTRSGSAPQLSAAPESATRLRVVPGDLTSFQAFPESIDAVIHTAAVSPTSEIATADFIRHNIRGTERLIAASVAAGVKKFIFFSSLSVYGDIQRAIADEDTPVLNPGPYGISKLLGEFLLRDQATKLTSIALRLPAVLGRGASRHWLASMTLHSKTGCDIKIYNPDALFNNAVHVESLAELIESLLQRTWTGFDAITLGAAGGLRISEIASRVVEAAGTNVRVSLAPSQSSSFTISSERARVLYGYKPMDFKVMLDRYLLEL